MFDFLNELTNKRRNFNTKNNVSTFKIVGVCPICGGDLLEYEGFYACSMILQQRCEFRIKHTIDDKKIELNDYLSTINELKHRLSTVNSSGLGKNLESKFRHVLSVFVLNNRRNIKSSYMDYVGVENHDKFKGTDFVLNYGDKKIRIDITARDENYKDNMTLIKNYDYFKLYSRNANIVREFDESVLVYVVPHFNEDDIINSMIEIYVNMEETIDLFLEHFLNNNSEHEEQIEL